MRPVVIALWAHALAIRYGEMGLEGWEKWLASAVVGGTFAWAYWASDWRLR